MPLANYKMIGALAVKRGELQKAELANFTASTVSPASLPTQGHIPPVVPFMGL